MYRRIATSSGDQYRASFLVNRWRGTGRLEQLVMLRDTGDMPITSANEMNVPVVCMLHEPDREGGTWTWTAVNFMPRKEYCGSGYHLEADTRDEIMETVNKHVVPLYEIATNNLKAKGENYYWEA